MPQFMFNLLKDSQVRDPSILNRMVSDIKNALDVMGTNNFAAGIVPYTSLECGASFVPMVLRFSGTVAGPYTGMIDLSNIPDIGVLEDMSLVSILGTARNVVGGDIGMSVYRIPAAGGPAILIETEMTLFEADPPPQKNYRLVDPPVAFYNGDLILFYINVGAGETLYNPTMVALFTAAHASS